MSSKRTTRQQLLEAVRIAAEHYARTETKAAIKALQDAATKAIQGGASAEAVSDATTEGVERAESGEPQQAAPEPKAATSRPRKESAPKPRTSQRKARTSRPVAQAPSMAEGLERAAGMGEEAFRRGEGSAPGQSVEFASLLSQYGSLSTKDKIKLMSAYSDAWHRANVAAPVDLPPAPPSSIDEETREIEERFERSRLRRAEERAAEDRAALEEAETGTPEAVAEEAAAEVIEAPVVSGEPEVEVRVSGYEPGSGGGWEGALSTRLAATNCCFCGRELRDPQSIERGYGPECAEKHWMPDAMPESLDVEAALRAFALMPQLLRASMERLGGKVSDPEAEWRASPEVRRTMVSSALYIGALAVSFGANEISVIRARIDSSKQVLASLQQMARAFGYERCSSRLATKYTERLQGQMILFRRSQKPGYMGVHVPFSDKWLEWCRGNRDYFSASQREGSLFIRFFREDKLGEIANALHGCFGDTICLDADGNMVPLPTMHIEAEIPAPAEDVTADSVEVIEEVQPYAVPEKIKLGDMVMVDGRQLPVLWIDPGRQRVGLGRKPVGGGYEVFKSYAEIKQENGREIAKELYNEVTRYAQEIGAPEQPKMPTVEATARPIPVLSDGQTLDPHQIRGVEFIDGKRGRVLLADEMGLGKTITATVCIDVPCVVVCPSNLKVNWSREVLKWKQGVTVSIINGTEEPGAVEKRADVVIINYDIIDSHVEWITRRNNKTVVADEAHYLKELDIRWDKAERIHKPESKSPVRGKAFYAIQKNVQRLLLLTGTPVMNRTRELFPLLHMLNPEEWGSSYAFCVRYCGGEKGTHGFDCSGRTNSEELFHRVNEKYMLRRTVDVLNLPPKRYEPMAVTLSEDVREKYAKQARDIVSWVYSNGGAAAALRAEKAKVLVQLNKLRETTAEGKADAAVDWIKRHWVSTNRPLVVMATHQKCFDRMREGVDRLNREYAEQISRGETPDMQSPIRYGSVVGGMGSPAVAKVVDQFQGDPKKGVAPTLDLVFYSIALAVGTTLTRAQDMLFVERAWRPADLAQAEARIFRRGQKNKCLFAYLDAEGTIDGKLALMLKAKSQTIASVVCGVNLDDKDAAAFILGEMFLPEETIRRNMRANPRANPESIVADSWSSPL